MVLQSSNSSQKSLAHTAVTDPSVQEVHLKHPTRFFPQALVLLKLRWLLRLHSACCELDYKVCSLRPFIVGLQYVILQQHAEMQSDGGFDAKVCNHIGSHLNLESVLDDLFDQLQKTLGTSWRAFLEYVGSCDPSRSLHRSSMDLGASQIVSNDALAMVLDSIFVANILRQPSQGATRLREVYDELERMGLAVPELPRLHNAVNLRAWAVSKTKPTRASRERVQGKTSEKLAQLDALLITAAAELHSPEVLATEAEIEADERRAAEEAAAQYAQGVEGFPSSPLSDTGDMESGLFSSQGRGPPAAKVIADEKPKLKSWVLDTAMQVVHYHHTFPVGIREKLYSVLTEEYGLTKDQHQRLAIAATQNIDGKRLPEYVLLEMDHREKNRLRNYQAKYGSITTHLLSPPLVQAPIERGKPAMYTLERPPVARLPFGSSFSSNDMTKSLPDLRGFTGKRMPRGTDIFRVPLSTGPLTIDPDLNKLRTTGFFVRMPPL
jgi:hypothetical protein